MITTFFQAYCMGNKLHRGMARPSCPGSWLLPRWFTSLRRLTSQY